MTKILFGLSFILLLSTGLFKFMCSPGKAVPQFKSVKDIKIELINNDTIKINLIAIVQNNSKSSINTEKLFLNILSGKDTIGYAVSLKDVEFKPDINNIPMQVYLKTSSLIKSISSVKNDSLILNLAGKVKAKIALFNPEFEVNSPFVLSLKNDLLNPLIEGSNNENIIAVNSIRIKDIGLNSTKIVVEFTFRSPFNLEYELLSYPSTISIYNSKVGKGDLLNSPLKIKNGITKGKFLFNASNFMSVGAGLSTIFHGGLADYYIEGILHLRIFNNDLSLPYSKSGKINFRE